MTEQTKANLAAAVFFAACLLPAAGMLLPERTAAANQALAPPPILTRPDGRWNPALLQDTADYIGDHFAFRQELITMQAALEAAVFHSSAEDSVLLGRDGWLFYQQTLPGYLHTQPMSERQLYAAAHTLALINEYAAAQGAYMLFTVAPNKCSLYPQYLPETGSPLPGASDIDRLLPLLAQEGVPYADLFAAFRAQPETLYFRLDSHWNTRGAALAHDTLTAVLGVDDPFFPGGFETVRSHRGDLYEMLYPAGSALDEDIRFDRPFTFTHVGQPRSPEAQRIETEQPARSGSLLMFRDSFGNSLYPFMAESYGHAIFSRAMPYPLSLLEGADTLVIELVERNLDWLSSRAPIFPAPLRGLTGEPLQGSAQAQLHAADDGQLPGFHRIEGALTGAVDVQSPIYVRFGDTLYEACPSGTGTAYPFTLYVPESLAANQAQILYLADGILHTALPPTEAAP